MKWILLIALALPVWANAQVDRNVNIEDTTVIGVDKNGNKTVSQQRVIRQTEGVRDIYSACKSYEWKTQLSKNNSFKCNWSYRTAMTEALTFALDGFKIDWYDEQSGDAGSIIVAHSMPYSDQGWCRLVIAGELAAGGTKYGNPFYMCYNVSNQRWEKFKGR